MLVIGIAALILIFAAAFYLIGKRARETRCPRCGRSFAVREVSRDQTPGSVYDTTTHVGLITRDLKGNVTGTDARVVPATAYVYNCVDECKFCGFQKEEQRTQVRRNRMK